MIISIIVATWNSGRTLRDTLESLYSQTWKDVEVVVIDGQSTDNTIDIVKKYEKRFEGRLKWISEPDHGLYDAMNKGLTMATGDVVGILNSDDFKTSTAETSIHPTTFLSVWRMKLREWMRCMAIFIS